MTTWIALALALTPAGPGHLPVPALHAVAPVTFEYYYRIKWGASEEFKRLYRKNHEPLLLEMQKLGFITAMRTDEPFTHMAGGERWDLRVTIAYRDGAAAVELGGAWDTAWGAAKARLFPDKAAYDAEETHRFSLLEEHWDVIVIPAG
jgi:hypothetical protein